MKNGAKEIVAPGLSGSPVSSEISAEPNQIADALDQESIRISVNKTSLTEVSKPPETDAMASSVLYYGSRGIVRILENYSS